MLLHFKNSVSEHKIPFSNPEKNKLLNILELLQNAKPTSHQGTPVGSEPKCLGQELLQVLEAFGARQSLGNKDSSCPSEGTILGGRELGAGWSST